MPPTNRGQNLINPVMAPLPSLIKGSPAAFYKAIALDVLSVASALAVGYSYHEYLTAGMSPFFALGAFLVFGMFSAIQSLLCRNAGRRLFVIMCEVAALASFFYVFYAAHWRFLLAAAASAFILFLWGYLGSRSEIKSSMDVRPFRMTKSAIGNVVTGMIVFMIVIYIPLWNQNSIFIPQKSFDALFDWGAGVVNSFYPTIPLSGSVGDFMNSVARVQLENTASFQDLSFENKNALVAQSATGIIDNISKNTGINIQQSDTISATMYKFIIKTLAGWENRFPTAFLIGWGIVLFFAARSVGIVFVWIDQLFFIIFYEALLMFRFMRIKEEPRMKEVLEY